MPKFDKKTKSKRRVTSSRSRQSIRPWYGEEAADDVEVVDLEEAVQPSVVRPPVFERTPSPLHDEVTDDDDTHAGVRTRSRQRLLKVKIPFTPRKRVKRPRRASSPLSSEIDLVSEMPQPVVQAAAEEAADGPVEYSSSPSSPSAPIHIGALLARLSPCPPSELDDQSDPGEEIIEIIHPAVESPVQEEEPESVAGPSSTVAPLGDSSQTVDPEPEKSPSPQPGPSGLQRPSRPVSTEPETSPSPQPGPSGLQRSASSVSPEVRNQVNDGASQALNAFMIDGTPIPDVVADSPLARALKAMMPNGQGNIGADTHKMRRSLEALATGTNVVGAVRQADQYMPAMPLPSKDNQLLRSVLEQYQIRLGQSMDSHAAEMGRLATEMATSLRLHMNHAAELSLLELKQQLNNSLFYWATEQTAVEQCHAHRVETDQCLNKKLVEDKEALQKRLQALRSMVWRQTRINAVLHAKLAAKEQEERQTKEAVAQVVASTTKILPLPPTASVIDVPAQLPLVADLARQTPPILPVPAVAVPTATCHWIPVQTVVPSTLPLPVATADLRATGAEMVLTAEDLEAQLGTSGIGSDCVWPELNSESMATLMAILDADNDNEDL